MLQVPSRSMQRRGLARRVGSENIAALLFLSPFLLGLILIVAGPMLTSLYFSFTNYTASGTAKWVGFDNYVRAFTKDPRFWRAATTTGLYVLLAVPTVIVFALLLAALLNRGVRGLTLYRAMFYVPSLIGGSVAIALLWRRIFGANGLLNAGLGMVGIEVQTSWIGSPSTSLMTLVVLHGWQFGSAMIIFLAGMRQIPQSYYEAAIIDGATKFQCFFKITLPLLTPLILFSTVMNTVAAFQAFNAAYVVSAGSGGPADSLLFFTLYIYQQGFVNFNFGYASALGWLLIVAIAAAVSMLLLATRRFIHYGENA
ncbi:multiple sugar transport system permease protein [Rhizobium sp. SLBN-94]|nr:multiple sugar transport system permease protein [Rhizobium sp. SLBN-94]